MPQSWSILFQVSHSSCFSLPPFNVFQRGKWNRWQDFWNVPGWIFFLNKANVYGFRLSWACIQKTYINTNTHRLTHIQYPFNIYIYCRLWNIQVYITHTNTTVKAVWNWFQYSMCIQCFWLKATHTYSAHSFHPPQALMPYGAFPWDATSSTLHFYSIRFGWFSMTIRSSLSSLCQWWVGQGIAQTGYSTSFKNKSVSYIDVLPSGTYSSMTTTHCCMFYPKKRNVHLYSWHKNRKSYRFVPRSYTYMSTHIQFTHVHSPNSVIPEFFCVIKHKGWKYPQRQKLASNKNSQFDKYRMSGPTGVLSSELEVMQCFGIQRATDDNCSKLLFLFCHNRLRYTTHARLRACWKDLSSTTFLSLECYGSGV